MSFKVSLTLSETELGKVLGLLTKQQLAGVEITPTDAPARKSKGAVPVLSPHAANQAVVMRGDRNDEPLSSVGQKILAIHEKLEHKYGIGTVTRGDLGAACTKAKLSRHSIRVLLKGGWLVYVTGE